MLIVLSIGSLPVGFEIRSKEMVSRIRRRYHGFIQKDARPLLTLHCFFSSKFLLDNKDVIIEQIDNNALNICRSDFVCTFNNPAELDKSLNVCNKYAKNAGPFNLFMQNSRVFVADKDSNECGEIYMRRSIYSFDACLRVLYSTLLTANRGLLLHATGIVKGRRAHLFLGPSGSGKTTVAKLSSSIGTVLNDEIVALRIGNNGIAKVYGTPFWGEMRKGPAYNKPSQLQAIYFLNKSRKTFKAAITRRNALTRLLRCCCIFSSELYDTETVMQTAITLVNSVPAYELHLKKDQSFWEIV